MLVQILNFICLRSIRNSVDTYSLNNKWYVHVYIYITHTYCVANWFKDLFLFLIVGQQWVWREEIWQRSLVTKMVLFTQFYRTIAWDHNTGSDIHWLYFQNSLNIISSLTITNIIVLYMVHALTNEKWKSFDWAITIPYFNQKRRGDIAHLSEIGHKTTNKRSFMVSNKQINISHCVNGY